MIGLSGRTGGDVVRDGEGSKSLNTMTCMKRNDATNIVTSGAMAFTIKPLP
jgi:hypothetical protein